MQTQAIIFDMNGVVLMDERIHQKSWKILCKNFKITPTEEEFKNNIFGRTEKETLEYIFKRKFSGEELENYSLKRISIVKKLLGFCPKSTPGFISFLRKISVKKLPVAIATSSRNNYTDFILERLKIRSYFRIVVTAEDVIHGKPDPEIYIKTASLLNVETAGCVVFEDSLSGIKSAQAAGMKVIAITTTHRKEELSGADRIIEGFLGLPASVLEF